MDMKFWLLETHKRVFPILCQIRLIRWIRLIQLESVKHDWSLLYAFLCLLLTVDPLV